MARRTVAKKARPARRRVAVDGDRASPSVAPSWLPWGLALLLAAATALAYANAVHGALVHDDSSVDPSALPTTLAGIATLFRERLWANLTSAVALYRPLLFAGFAVENLLHGPDPRAFHATTVALHVAATLALFGFLRALLADGGHRGARASLPAFAAALIFGVHPIHTDAIDSVFNRSDVVVALCALGAMWLVWRHEPTRPALAWAGAAALYFAALLHKESAVCIPPLLALLPLLRPDPPGWRALARRAAPVLWLAIPTAVYLLMRRSALGGFVPAAEPTIPWGQRVTFTAATVVDAFRMVAWPHPLRASYADDRPAWPLASCALVLALLAAAARWWRRSPSAFVGFVGFLACLLPSTKIVTGQLAHYLGERHIYLGTAVLAIPLAVGLARAFERWGAVPLAASLVVVPALAMLTWERNEQWHSNVALFEAEAAAAPQAGDSWRLLTGAYLGVGRPDEAALACDAHLASHWGLPLLANNCAGAYERVGRDADAERAYRRAADLGLGSVARHNLGRLLARLGRSAEAEEQYRRSAAEETDPVRKHYRQGMTLVLFHPDRLAEARREFEAALALQPRYEPARRMLGGAGP